MRLRLKLIVSYLQDKTAVRKDAEIGLLSPFNSAVPGVSHFLFTPGCPIEKEAPWVCCFIGLLLTQTSEITSNSTQKNTAILDNIMTSTFNSIPHDIGSALNVKSFNVQSKAFYYKLFQLIADLFSSFLAISENIQ